MEEIEIGLGKSGRRAYGLDDVAIIANRRTRDAADVDTSWEIDAYRFSIPLLGVSSDSVTSPATAIRMGELGGIGVLDLEGVWTRHEAPEEALSELAQMPLSEAALRLRELYAAPVRPDLINTRISEIAAAGVRTAARVRPRSAVKLTPFAIEAEVDLLAISGSVVSAEHLSSSEEPLNLKTFIRGLHTPVVVGGCVSYQAALHLMRTGAAGVLVGFGSGDAGTSRDVLGLESPLATAIADARAARMRHLDETGVYCHVIANDAVRTAGDIAKAIVCGADAVTLGLPLAAATDAPCPGRHWNLSSSHLTLPRGRIVEVPTQGTLAEIIHGPGLSSDGTTNLIGGLRTSMAKCGSTDVKDFQRAALAVVTP